MLLVRSPVTQGVDQLPQQPARDSFDLLQKLGNNTCGKYYPLTVINQTWNKPVTLARYIDKALYAQANKTLGANELAPGTTDWTRCSVLFTPLDTTGSAVENINLGTDDFLSTSEARGYFSFHERNISLSSDTSLLATTSVTVGDEAKLYHTKTQPKNAPPGTAPIEFFTLVARKGSRIYTVMFFKTSDQPKAENLLGRVVGQPLSTPLATSATSPSLTPSPSKTPDEKKVPQILKVSHQTVSAGKKDRIDPASGKVIYVPEVYVLEIEGDNLEGAQLSSDSIAINGRKSGLEFKNIEVRSRGKKVYAHLIAHPSAKESKVTVTLTNQDGLSTTFPITVTITGTQYLTRAFAKRPVIFKGDWSEIAPTPRVRFIEDYIQDGLQKLAKPSYARLNIYIVMYEASFWNGTECGADTDDTIVQGCASAQDNLVYIREIENTSSESTIFHEAVHKLTFYYRGVYRGIPEYPDKLSDFPRRWWLTAQPSSDESCGEFLPLVGTVLWKDKTSNVPHCGYSRAYGASDRILYLEDIATMAQDFVFRPDFLTRYPDPKTDKRYTNKINLLKQYEFLP